MTLVTPRLQKSTILILQTFLPILTPKAPPSVTVQHSITELALNPTIAIPLIHKSSMYITSVKKKRILRIGHLPTQQLLPEYLFRLSAAIANFYIFCVLHSGLTM